MCPLAMMSCEGILAAGKASQTDDTRPTQDAESTLERSFHFRRYDIMQTPCTELQLRGITSCAARWPPQYAPATA